jgi:hypothetical protein
MISSLINMLFSFVLLLFLVVNFFRKRTVGTFMLLSSYFFFTATAAVSIIYRFLFIANGAVINEITYLLASLGPLLLLPAFGFLYIFACRHILKDNEIIRMFIFAFIMFFFGIATALVGYDVYASNPVFHLLLDDLYVNPLFFSDPVTITPHLFTVSYWLAIQLMQIIVSIYVTGRIGWRALRLARKSDQPVRKRGLQTIGLGTILYLLGGMLSAFDESLAGIPGLMITVATLRAFAFAAAYVMMYLGWIMPTWFRKMIRKRSWFEIQYQQLAKS